MSSLRNSLKKGMGSKAQERLGLNANSKTKVLEVQSQGWLYKRPFSKGLRGKTWQKRYFVLKDSLLLWYSSKPSGSFDINPNGCLPLSGASTFPMGKENGYFIFEISHPDFGGNTLQLKSNDKSLVDHWIKVLHDCSKASWQNAMLGDALIQKLKHKGTALEKEMEKTLQDARRTAEEANEERDQKLSLMEKQLESQRQYEEELLAQKKTTQQLENEMESKAKQIEREKREQEEELQRAKAMETKLQEACKAIQRLEAALEKRQRTDLPGLELNPELQEHLETIKVFMENRNLPSAA